MTRRPFPSGHARGAFVAAAFCLAVGGTITAAEAAPPCASLRAALSGDSVAVDLPDEGAVVVRLLSIDAPRRPMEVPAAAPWPLEDAARDAIREIASGQCLFLVTTPRRLDRHQRVLTHLTRSDGAWVQAELVSRGLARVVPGMETMVALRSLYTLEQEARQAGRGLWANEYYAVRTAGDAAQAVGAIHIVEGRVVKATRIDQRVYLNFGADWRSDFTVVIPSKALKAFAQAGVDPLRLGRTRLRVRGWVGELNGPMIEIDDPGAIEILADADDGEEGGRSLTLRAR